MMESVDQIISKAESLGFKYEAERGSCPQCVLAALHETIGIGDGNLIRSADSLAGGTALSTQGTCGALVGGMLALGFLEGRNYEDFSLGKRNRLVFKFVKKLYNRFLKEYGSPLCKDVQKKIFGRSYILLDTKEYSEFEEAGAHRDKCPSVAGNVTKWTAEIILNEIKIEKFIINHKSNKGNQYSNKQWK
jgi:C_GCAxxG_C_C family probable redox protein